MATYYIDKRVAINGNGSQANPWKEWNEAGNVSIVGVSPTIEIVAGSGPYYPSDCTYLGQGKLYMNYNNGGTATINFNGNVFDFQIDLMSATYKWNKSTTANLWYATLANGSAITFTTKVTTGIVNGFWDAESTSLFGQYPTVTDTTHIVKWGYGNVDGLSANTVYVRSQAVDMSDIKSVNVAMYGTEIFAKESNAAAASFIFNDGIFKGGGQLIVRNSATVSSNTFNRCSFSNSDILAINCAGPVTANYCSFISCGHSIINEGPSNRVVNNAYVENCHLLFKFDSTTNTNTVTVRNTKSKNLLAGFVRFETSSLSTFVEDHNHIHIDMINIHGGDAINEIRAGYTAKWTTTAASDIPASTATSYTGPFVLPETVVEGIGGTITGLHDQTTAAKDIDGKTVLFLPPSMGCVDGRTTKVISSTDYAPTGYTVRSPAKLIITGGGNINLSGLTDAGSIDVIATPGSTIKAFTGNGINTNLKAIATNKAPGYSRNFR